MGLSYEVETLEFQLKHKFPQCLLFFKINILLTHHGRYNDLFIVYALPHSFFWKNMNWKESSWIKRLAARFCHHDHVYSGRGFSEAACGAGDCTTWAGASESSAVTLFVWIMLAVILQWPHSNMNTVLVQRDEECCQSEETEGSL